MSLPHHASLLTSSDVTTGTGDETKPACLNCQARSVACIYPGADLRFPGYNANQTEDEGFTKATGQKGFTVSVSLFTVLTHVLDTCTD